MPDTNPYIHRDVTARGVAAHAAEVRKSLEKRHEQERKAEEKARDQVQKDKVNKGKQAIKEYEKAKKEEERVQANNDKAQFQAENALATQEQQMRDNVITIGKNSNGYKDPFAMNFKLPDQGVGGANQPQSSTDTGAAPAAKMAMVKEGAPKTKGRLDWLLRALKYVGSFKKTQDLAATGALTAAWDRGLTPELGESGYPFTGPWGRHRETMTGVNAALSLIGVLGLRRGMFNKGPMTAGRAAMTATGAGSLGLVPVKDLAVMGMPAVKNWGEAGKTLNEKMEAGDFTPVPPPPSQDSTPALPSWVAPAALGLGATGLGLYGLNMLRQRRERQEDREAEKGRQSISHPPRVDGGRLKVHLPSPKDGLSDTTVELPIEDVGLSKALLTNIGRDVRRRLRKGTDKRTYRRDDETGDLIPFTIDDVKSASDLNSHTLVDDVKAEQKLKMEREGDSFGENATGWGKTLATAFGWVTPPHIQAIQRRQPNIRRIGQTAATYNPFIPSNKYVHSTRYNIPFLGSGPWGGEAKSITGAPISTTPRTTNYHA